MSPEQQMWMQAIQSQGGGIVFSQQLTFTDKPLWLFRVQWPGGQQTEHVVASTGETV